MLKKLHFEDEFRLKIPTESENFSTEIQFASANDFKVDPAVDIVFGFFLAAFAA